MTDQALAAALLRQRCRRRTASSRIDFVGEKRDAETSRVCASMCVYLVIELWGICTFISRRGPQGNGTRAEGKGRERKGKGKREGKGKGKGKGIGSPRSLKPFSRDRDEDSPWPS